MGLADAASQAGAGAGSQPAAKRPRQGQQSQPGVVERLADVLLSKDGVQRFAALPSFSDDALALATASGIVMYKEPALKDKATAVPIAMLPTPVDADLYREANLMVPTFHKLMDRVAVDLDWMREALGRTAASDAICAGLLDVCSRVYGPGGRTYSEDLRLHITRNDFMLDQAAAPGSLAMVQIEMNMIAASFSTHAEDLTEVHRHLLCKHARGVDAALTSEVLLAELREVLPRSPCAANIAAAIAEAHRAYAFRRAAAGGEAGRPQAVLFVSEANENNELDHRKLERALFRDHGVIALRRSLRQLASTGASSLLEKDLGKGSAALVVDGHEISVAYFRSGYWPEHFTPSGACWQVREAIEASDAVKCPSAPAQLAGMKKIQQLLASPAVLRRFLPEAGLAERLERCFARMGDASGATAEDRACVDDARSDPSKWVLKPQVEGSGDLTFNDDIPRVLQSKSKAELAEFILMERVWPPVTPSAVCVSEPEGAAKTVVRDSLAELGIFGTFLASGSLILRNTSAGHLLRSKAQSTLQGGVFVGNAVVDSPLLLPSKVFWDRVKTSA